MTNLSLKNHTSDNGDSNAGNVAHTVIQEMNW